MVFSLPALVGLVSLFLKGEIEREMGRENNKGGGFCFLLTQYFFLCRIVFIGVWRPGC